MSKALTIGNKSGVWSGGMTAGLYLFMTAYEYLNNADEVMVLFVGGMIISVLVGIVVAVIVSYLALWGERLFLKNDDE